MKNAVKRAVSRTKQFVADHRVAIAVVATSVAWYRLNRRAVEEHDNFLVEKGLYDEFYTPSDIEEV